MFSYTTVRIRSFADVLDAWQDIICFDFEPGTLLDRMADEGNDVYWSRFSDQWDNPLSSNQCAQLRELFTTSGWTAHEFHAELARVCSV